MSIDKEKKIELIRTHLVSGTREEKVAALCAITPDLINELLEPVINLTTHWRPELKVAALHALRAAETDKIQGVIRDSLKDTNRDVRLAASELYHGRKLAA